MLLLFMLLIGRCGGVQERSSSINPQPHPAHERPTPQGPGAYPASQPACLPSDARDVFGGKQVGESLMLMQQQQLKARRRLAETRASESHARDFVGFMGRAFILGLSSRIDKDRSSQPDLRGCARSPAS